MAQFQKKTAQPPFMVENTEALPGVEALEAEVAAAKTETSEIVATQAEIGKHVQANIRSIAEKGILEARSKYMQAKSTATEATSAVEASYGAAQKGVIAFNVKAIEAFKARAEANFDLFKSLAGVKTMSELVTLNTEFARKQFEDASARSKELAELARKVADEAAAPIKAHVAKTFKIAV